MKHEPTLTSGGRAARHIVAALSLVILALSSTTALAQNPAYGFASAIGSTETDAPNAIAIDESGNLYVTGHFTGTVDFDPGVGTATLTYSGRDRYDSDIFVASYDAAGNYRWAFRAGGVNTAWTGGSSDNRGGAIAIDASGNVVVTGRFFGTSDFDPGVGTANLTEVAGATYGNVFVAKYTPAGAYLWAFGLPSIFGTPALAVDGSSNIVVSGTFKGTVDFNPGSGTASLAAANYKKGQSTSDGFLAKYSPSGGYLWAFKIGSKNDESAGSVATDGSGNVYVTGNIQPYLYVPSTTASAVDFDPGRGTASITGFGAFVAKYSAAGAYVWVFRLTVASYEGPRVAVDAAGNAVVAGSFTGTVDFDPGSGIAALTGSSTGSAYDVFVARYSSSGAYQWAFTPTIGTAYGLSIDGNGDVVLAGRLNGANDFDPGSGTVSLDRDASYGAAFAASYSSAGTYRWAFSLVGPVIGRAIVSDANGNVYLTGTFNATVDFDPDEATAGLTTSGRADIFIAKYSATLLPRRTNGAGGRIGEIGRAPRIAPNPFRDGFRVRLEGGTTPATIEVVDMTGRVVESHTVDGTNDLALGDELPAGTYVVRIVRESAEQTVIAQKVR